MPRGFKAGGRKKGTPNKKTQTLQELIEEYYPSFDPILELIEISQQEDLQNDLKISILKNIAEYIYPKRKAIEAEITAIAEKTISMEEMLDRIDKLGDDFE